MSFHAHAIHQSPQLTATTEQSSVDHILHTETSQNKQQPWSKLNKTDRISKLNQYVHGLQDKHDLEPSEMTTLKRYLVTALERKRLSTVKDLQYDADEGLILNIPALTFDETDRTFILRRSESRSSTLKSLTRKIDS